MKFDFISDQNFREILERDFEELNKCAANNCTKSVLLLSGSIIEAILADYFINFSIEGLKKKAVLSMDLFGLIEKAYEAKLISQSTKELSTVIKNYRNLIHPGREIRKNESFDENTGDVAKSVLNIIVKEVRENYLNKIGYTANDLILKLESDELSQPIFEKILTKVHKGEKHKLYKALVEYGFNLEKFEFEIEGTKKYLRILKTQIDREVIENLLRKMIKKIETGGNWEVLSYYRLLHEEIKYLEYDEIEFILLYILNTFIGNASDPDKISSYTNDNLLASFGTYLNSESVKKEFFKLICKLVENHTKKDYVYFDAYDQLVNSVTAEKKAKIETYVRESVMSIYSERFYAGYDNGEYLPF
ncbi:hypothetical protein [Cyclobacterium sp.]|uniref:hypothetical protein n=1 Tax=Cyclobacterium sp. TaxID=1966343 RepID=UPI0019B1BBC7|nr:hypothetical protein [Cyclobacterium sp.]MBD3630497.1 hypothetical protein [Cyclobacterium sp.]